ncbi:MAG: hypothetical protein GEU73_04115 [Chloroflexi bacterium]|nr:hypothetical protein [Chloroflexota bacterium]
MAKAILNVPEISCEHCEHAITEALAPQAGVRTVAVDIPAKTVTLDYDEAQIDLPRVGTLLDEEGYPVESAVPA